MDNKTPKIADLFTEIRDRRIMNLIDSPGLTIAKEIQQRMDQFSPPALRKAVESQRRMEQLMNPFRSSSRLFLDYNFSSLFHKSLSASLFMMKTFSTTPDFFKILKSLNLKIEDLELFDSKDTSVEAYELDFVTDSAPEQKIIYLHEANRLYTTIVDIYNNNDLLYKMPARQFEEVIAELLRNKNFEVELTKQTRDGGYDIIAVQNLAGFPLRFLVECKRFAKNRPVGIDIIRSFSHVIQTHNANKGIIFTSSYFSPDAKIDRVNNMPHLLDFKDNSDIMDWIRTYVQPPIYL